MPQRWRLSFSHVVTWVTAAVGCILAALESVSSGHCEGGSEAAGSSGRRDRFFHTKLGAGSQAGGGLLRQPVHHSTLAN